LLNSIANKTVTSKRFKLVNRIEKYQFTS